MNQNDWKQIGDDIYNAVMDAIESDDFKNLNKKIKEGTKQAAYMAGSGMKMAGESMQKMTKTKNGFSKEVKATPDLYKKLSNKKVGGLILGFTAGFFSCIFALVIMVLLGVAIAVKEILPAVMIPISIILPLFLISCGFCYKAQADSKLIMRFEQYKKCLADKTFIGLAELARTVGETEPFVRKDLQKMIQKTWFLEGHLSEEKDYLITSDETFHQYELMKEQERQREAERKKTGEHSPEVEAVLTSGRNYIKEIRTCNDRISGEKMSEKIHVMEQIVDKIFDRVDEKPEMVNDIRKLMSYYLPMTIKLLQSYEQLEKQPVQGENILRSKNEIEESLDTINQAFETLLDQLFQEQTWDVSADISVLQTMFAQDGLTKNDK